jgi:hypothetical protein
MWLFACVLVACGSEVPEARTGTGSDALDPTSLATDVQPGPAPLPTPSDLVPPSDPTLLDPIGADSTPKQMNATPPKMQTTTVTVTGFGETKKAAENDCTIEADRQDFIMKQAGWTPVMRSPFEDKQGGAIATITGTGQYFQTSPPPAQWVDANITVTGWGLTDADAWAAAQQNLQALIAAGRIRNFTDTTPSPKPPTQMGSWGAKQTLTYQKPATPAK